MRRTGRITLFFGIALVGACGVLSTPSWGQDASDANVALKPLPPNFPILFPHPTNNNGYEEWVQAADLIQNNATVAALVDDEQPTLASKRRALADPAVAQALQLLRAGLNKPIYSPRTNYDEYTLMPELVTLRKLARLLVTEQYVAFADGRVDAAVRSMRDGLAFGYHIQTDTIISGLVGISIDTIVLKEFSKHLDQLSAYHCVEVRRIIENFLGAENSTGRAVRLLALERGYTLQLLESKRSNIDGLLALLKAAGGDEEQNEDPDFTSIQAHLKSHPADLNAMLDDAESRVNTLFDQTLDNMRLPVAQRKPIVKDNANSPGAALFRSLTMDPQSILDRYTKDQAQLRLLGVDVLIHHYRWDNAVLPNSLTELRAPDLVKDAFMGSEIVYKREGDRYTLASQKSARGIAAGK